MEWKQVVKTNYTQLIFVFAAFFVVVLASYLSISGIVRRHLAENVDDSILTAQANINVGLSEAEVALTSLAYAVQGMLDRGEPLDTVRSFMAGTTAWMRRRGDESLGFNGVYGFIRGEFINGIGLNFDADYIPQRRPWYEASVRGGKEAVSFTEPYANIVTGQMVITAVKNIVGSSGEHFGIMALDIDPSWFRKYVNSFRRSGGGYGMITNQYMVVVGHPNEKNLGRPLREIGGGYEAVYNRLMTDRSVSSERIVDETGARVIVSFRQMSNGWYVGVIVPIWSYYRDVYYTAGILSLIGAVMMFALCYILLRISAARIRSDEANRSKSSFLATMSHEIRTPLNAILGLSEIWLQRELPGEAHSDLEKIYASGSGLLNIINDILDISKIEAGGFEIIPADYDTATLIESVASLNMTRIGSKNISFELSIDETMPSKLHGDELRLRQVLNNLLSNAFKYTKEGRVSFETAWRRKDESAVLSFAVSDTGLGIKKDDMGKLFSKYQQLDTLANKNIEGTGLGLSITKSLVELMGGTISVESEYGVGSVFHVEFEQKIADSSPIGAKTANDLRHFRPTGQLVSRGKNLVRSLMPYGRVLVVDDVMINLDVVEGLLIPYGLTVDCVTNGRDAIERIRSAGSGPCGERYDVVFMDHMMPEMDGLEATRIIRNDIGSEYARTVPIVALTANALSGNEEMFLAAGFDDFLPKPIDIMRLDMALNKWVRDRRNAGDAQEAEKAE
ncbi:MAG: response regulator [Synergistaceae bacterium]|jgi:signal transduction histidine kinase/FixJ family two-component response regulator|nr:response regulator [Synergistaceae bacterium]